jgi:mannose-6-phosphate isomerase-like protein (cupin superfamily)
MIEKILSGDKVLGLIIRDNYVSEGVTFFTSNESSQQVAFMKHNSGKEIVPHVHNTVKREIFNTNEVLVIKKGRLRVDFYTEGKEYLESRILCKGDLILLLSGGHGFYMLEDVEMFEIKQGPYLGEADKNRFEVVNSEKIILK